MKFFWGFIVGGVFIICYKAGIIGQLLCLIGIHGHQKKSSWYNTLDGKQVYLIPTICYRCARLTKLEEIVDDKIVKCKTKKYRELFSDRRFNVD